MRTLATLTGLVVIILFNSCNAEKKQSASDLRAELMANFEKLADSQTGLLDKDASTDFVSAANSFADLYPTDTLAALPLYRSAEISRSIGKPKDAIETYKKILTLYPTFYKAAEAQFMLAFSYDEDLKDIDRARAAYTEFISEHPQHTFTDDAQMLLSNLGKSEEEILRELEAKLKENTEAPQ